MKLIPPLWHFSCEYYQQADIEQLCLQLQDDYGMDIPLLFFCVWSGYYFGELTDKTVQQAQCLTESYEAVCIQPLRRVRRQMKSQQYDGLAASWEPVRQQVKVAELNAERLLLEHLQRLLQTIPLTTAPLTTTPLPPEDLKKTALMTTTANAIKANLQRCYSPVTLLDTFVEQCLRFAFR
ncbi:MAG: TIGR02444 family protein [Cellvibrionaceae bacterium]|nr:TIGR02444 family protein [Cellvibrionaceae bacterium]